MKKETFEVWQAKVNSFLIRRCGFGIEDLPDFDYWSAWGANISPSETAKDVIQAAKDY